MERDLVTGSQALAERPKMRMITLHMTRDGSHVERQAALTTDTPGLYLTHTRDECDACWYAEEGAPCPGNCGQPITFSWHIVTEAGILVVGYLTKKLATEAATRLGTTGMDFTLDRAALLAQTGSPSWKLAARLVEEIRYRGWDRPVQDGGQADG